MRDEIAFSVVGVPQPKGSAKSFLHNQTQRVVTWADNRERLKPWEDAARGAALRARGRDCALWTGVAVHMDVTFVFARPRSVSARRRPDHVVKPDLSKLVRGLEDAFTGILFTDDAQIAAIVARKAYGEPARADVRLWVERAS